MAGATTPGRRVDHRAWDLSEPERNRFQLLEWLYDRTLGRVNRPALVQDYADETGRERHNAVARTRDAESDELLKVNRRSGEAGCGSATTPLSLRPFTAEAGLSESGLPPRRRA